MNYYIESVKEYILNEWDRSLNTSEGPKEARFIVQSLPHESVFELFNALEQKKQKLLKTQNIACQFRVASGLWNEWIASYGSQDLDQKMDEYGAIRHGNPTERLWIDEEDRLTWYRNRTAHDENAQALVVVLVGFNHATDKGGLSDFHRVDEDRIWSYLGKKFDKWIDHLNDSMYLQLNNEERDLLNGYLLELYHLRPLSLSSISDFISYIQATSGSFNSFTDFEEAFFRNLPFWKIPPLIPPQEKRELKKLRSYLRDAEAFISHKRFTENSFRKSTKNKIIEAIEDNEAKTQLTLPLTLNNIPPYKNIEEFKDTLFSFIDKADNESRSRLLNTDLLPLMRVLKSKTYTKKNPSTIKTLQGTSLEIFLRAIWIAIVDFAEKSENNTYLDNLSKIEIEILEFKHDLHNESETNRGESDTLARQLLVGCLGGLDNVFERIDIRVPVNSDEADLPSSQWNKAIPITFSFDIENLTCSKSNAPRLLFKVNILSEEVDTAESPSLIFYWSLPATHSERVFFETLLKTKDLFSQVNDFENITLPIFTLDHDNISAIYFAGDEEEANRLLINSVSNISLLPQKQPNTSFDNDFRQSLIQLALSYRSWLDEAIEQGIYRANVHKLPSFLKDYSDLAKSLLDSQKRGSEALLKIVYKSFFIVDDDIDLDDPFLPRAIAWGQHPAVLDLIRAHTVFLENGFPDVVGEIAVNHHNGKTALERLFSLAKIQRPITALVVEDQKLSAEVKSFGLIHCLGMAPETKGTLAAQSLFKNDEIDDDADEIIRDIIAPSEENELVGHVLEDYLDIYPYSQDGIRILAVNVMSLSSILSGLTFFLENFLKNTFPENPPFKCHIKVYSTGSSPITTEYKFGLWKDRMLEKFKEQDRPLLLSLEHRYVNNSKLSEHISQEKNIYDIAFLFYFLRNPLKAFAVEGKPFQFDFSSDKGIQFPITEYPFPIQKEEPHIRQSILSNRRLTIQTSHSDLSAQLFFKGNTEKDHLILAKVDYRPWKELLEKLHSVSQWVACIDPFIDKKLLCDENDDGNRKIVGFKSGLGNYGEINLTLSTEQDTLKKLTTLVEGKLKSLFPFTTNSPKDSEAIANRIINAAEEVIGLSSIRAISGIDERIRDVVGFSAISRILMLPPNQIMSQLLPIDSLLHWYAGANVTMKPDLLNLSLEIRKDDIPLINATILECKLAKKNSDYIQHAHEQILEGLQHLTQLLAPSHSDLKGISFDRRYWWSQLHRAITSRSEVSLLSVEERLNLNQALENIINGQYEIHWKAGIFAFWSDDKEVVPKSNPLKLRSGYVFSPYKIPDNFTIQLTELGYETFSSIFKDTGPSPIRIAISSPPITLRQQEDSPKDLNLLKNTTLKYFEEKVLEENNTAPSFPLGEPEIEIKTNVAEPLSPQYQEEFFQIPEKILIGRKQNQEPVYWHYGHPSLSNRHILIFGSSGSGKTYAIQCLLSEMAHQHLNSIIIDYTDGFLPAHLESTFSQICFPKNHIIIQNPLPINPFTKYKITIDPSIPPIEETPFIVASRVESIFSSIFDLGEQQKAALTKVITMGLQEEEFFSFEILLKKLQQEGSSGITLARKIELLIANKPFQNGDTSFWGDLIKDKKNWAHILQLKGFSQGAQKLITELALWDLWNYAQKFGTKSHPIPLVLDEIQNLNHKSDSPIDKLMREGRKFGLSLILATQTASQFDQEEKDRLFQAAHKLIFKPAQTEIASFSKILSQILPSINRDEWNRRLAKLEQGQCWSIGPTLRADNSLKEDVTLVNITSLENRLTEYEMRSKTP